MAFCSARGRSVAINQRQTVYSLFGVTYGGNGTTSFPLPNLHRADDRQIGPDGATTGNASTVLIGTPPGTATAIDNRQPFLALNFCVAMVKGCDLGVKAPRPKCEATRRSKL